MHPLLEFFPLIIFFAAYSFYGIYWATATLIIASAIQILFLFLTKKPIPKKVWILALLMTVMGGMTIYFQDDAFLKWKVTVVYAIFGLVLIISDKFYKNNLIKKALGEALTLPENIWSKMNIAWALFFTFIAVLNIYIAYSFELDTWVKFKVFGTMALMFIFIVINMAMIYKYFPKDDEVTNDSLPKIKTNDE
mgnify:CR=1 FL=1